MASKMMKASSFKRGVTKDKEAKEPVKTDDSSVSKNDMAYVIPEVPIDEDHVVTPMTAEALEAKKYYQRKIDDGMPVFMSDEERSKHESYERFGLTKSNLPKWDDFL